MYMLRLLDISFGIEKNILKEIQEKIDLKEIHQF